MSFALIELQNGKKTVVHKNQVAVQVNSIANCIIMGEKYKVVVNGYNDDYELLNHFASIHNASAFRIKLVKFDHIPIHVEGTEFEAQPLRRITQVIPEESRKRTSPKRIVKENGNGVELDDPLMPVRCKTRRINKANICKYCHKTNTNIRRHITSMHKNESEVQEFLLMSDDNPQKKRILSQIRRDGNFIGFTDKDHYIPSRHNQNFDTRNYIACSACKIIVKRESLRNHFRNNCQKRSSSLSKSPSSIMKTSKAISEKIHNIASPTMRNFIFPVFRNGPVKEVLRFDKLLLLYGNEMCSKYRAQHHYAMIRNRLIRLAKVLLQIKSLRNDIVHMEDILNPKYFDSLMTVINDMGQYNRITGNFEKPTLPTEIGTSLKYIINIFISECIKENNKTKRQKAKDLLHLLRTALPAHVNKTASESLLQYKRHKTPAIPFMEDIQKLNEYLSHGRVSHHEALERNFNEYDWLNLSRFTLIKLMVFNRRRPGEMERVIISDLKTIRKIEKNDDAYKQLCVEQRFYADVFLRFVIRGKLARGVPVLLDEELYKSIKLLIKYREKAGVLPDNPFIFGTPQQRSTNEENVVYRHLIATNLIRNFSEQCGAENPETLRATLLRKHAATITMSMNLDDENLHNFQNYMGHADKIHRDYYRQPIIEKDIVNVSKVLLFAQGESATNRRTNASSSSCSATITSASEAVTTSNINMDNDDRASTIYLQNTTATTSSRGLNIYRPFHDNADDDEGDPNFSPQQETSDSDEEEPKRKKRRLHDMVRNVASIKRRWTSVEKEAIRRIFASHFKLGRVPTCKDIHKAIEYCPELNRRTPPQIQMKIANDMKQNKITRKCWSSPARNIIKERFERYITSSSNHYPPTAAILKVIEDNPELSDKSPRRIRSQIQNQKNHFRKHQIIQQRRLFHE